MLYLLLKWLHVMAAITAVGANITYGVWLARSARSPESLAFTLRTVKVLDDRLANPAYALLLITGLIMAFVGNIPLTAPWILTALVLYAVLFVLGLLGYTPTLRKQIALAESVGPSSPEYRAAAARGRNIGIVLAGLVTVIVYLMVVKPPLWG